jgi:hypothetical protein
VKKILMVMILCGALPAVAYGKKELSFPFESSPRNRVQVAPSPNDRFEDVVDSIATRNIRAMESLKKGRVDVEAWSDSYWPVYAGGLASRYNDKEYTPSHEFNLNREYLQANQGKGELSTFSPAEKYDLLMGDEEFTLTNSILKEGSFYQERTGKVETWMGICHGWAAASFMVTRPSRIVWAVSPKGVRIPFYPADIKALASLLWATSAFSVKHIGGRCEEPEDLESTDSRHRDCLDTNAGTWHLAVVNQVGVAKRALIFDTSAKREVWNQPLISYRYSYIDPVTGEVISDLEHALRRLDETDPKFSQRAKGTSHLLTINMVVTFAIERGPEAVETDGPDRDLRGQAAYEYELELNAAGDIIGGEWVNDLHPDFVWTPSPGARALSLGDRWLELVGDRVVWDPSRPVHGRLKTAAKGSAEYRQPLARIVNALVKAATP